MKPSAFAYVRPPSLEAALEALARHAGDAKVLAGGQSLMPLLNFRLLRPSVLIDINRIPGLDGIDEDADGRIRIGALTRHFALESSGLVLRRLPVLQAAVAQVAHLAIRNRGTLGGSLSHADPAAELPGMAMLLDAEIAIRRAGGTRHLSARDFFLGTLATALADDEIVTDVSIVPPPQSAGWAFEEVSLRWGDFALAAVGAVLDLSNGRIRDARLAMIGLDETPVRADAAERLLTGERLDAGLIRSAAESARAAVHPIGDLRASADFRRHLAGALAERALFTAWRRAEGGSA